MIACARYRIDDERVKANDKRKIHDQQGKTHVIFLIHLPRYGGTGTDRGSTFVGFQGGTWISAHIDDIRVPSEGALTLDDALSAPISELFYNMPFSDDEVMEIEGNSLSDINTQNMELTQQSNMDLLSQSDENERVSTVFDAQVESSAIINEYDNIVSKKLSDTEMEIQDDQVSSIL